MTLLMRISLVAYFYIIYINRLYMINTSLEKDRELIEEKFVDSLTEVAKRWRSIYEKIPCPNRNYKGYCFCEHDFILWTYYSLVNRIKNSINDINEILSMIASEYISNKNSKGWKKIDLVFVKERISKGCIKHFPFIAAEFKYFKSGGLNLSNLRNICKRDFEKLKEENISCKKYRIYLANFVP